MRHIIRSKMIWNIVWYRFLERRKRKKVFFDSSKKFKEVFWQDDTTQPTMSYKFRWDRLSRHEAAYVRLREPFRGSILQFICSQLKCKRSFFELREKRLVLVEFLTRENRSFAIGCSREIYERPLYREYYDERESV